MRSPDTERPRIVDHPHVQNGYPRFFNELEVGLRDVAEVARVRPERFTDQTPNFKIENIPTGTPVAVVPGYISGPHAEDMLWAMTKVSHTLRYRHPNDPRTPRTEEVRLLLSDLEGRGNKPTATET